MIRTLTLVVLATCLMAAEPDLDALAGGKPLPAGSHTFTFPNMAKQSVSFVSNADEVIVGTVAFSGGDPVGSASFDVDAGTGAGQASIAVGDMATGNAMRDGHMRGGEWLEAGEYPRITFSDVVFERVKPTVWKVTGTWTIKGVSRELSSYANVRFIPTFPRVGDNVVRISTTFDLDLPAFGIDNPSVGSPAVARVWQAQVTLLGVKQ